MDREMKEATTALDRIMILVLAVVAVLLVAMLITPGVGLADVRVAKDNIGDPGAYSSFTQAIYETVDSGEDVIVFPGEYDIRAEYEELFGAEAIEDLPYDKDIGNDFQLGVILKDRRVIFQPGAKLVCVWYQPADEEHKFCPLYVYKNVYLYGLDLYAEGMTYAVHDDVWMMEEPYINEYHYCKIVGRRLTNANCIGGGCGKYSRHVLDHCFFDNGVADSLTVRYHNNTFPDSHGDIWITNCIFNGRLGICYMGDDTNQVDVYVSGCVVQIEVRHEVPEAAENMDLYSWNNHGCVRVVN